VKKRTVSVSEYIDSLGRPFREKFLAARRAYVPRDEAIACLRGFAKKFVIVAFSAGWCKDCCVNISALAIISKATGLEVRVFGGLKKDPLSRTRKWRVPPSPPEVETFDVQKIPTILVVNAEGEEMGRLVENPKCAPSLEEELCAIIKSHQ
jgi:hypothetical protein